MKNGQRHVVIPPNGMTPQRQLNEAIGAHGREPVNERRSATLTCFLPIRETLITMSSSSATAATSRSPSPATPASSDSLDTVAVEHSDLTSWYFSLQNDKPSSGDPSSLWGDPSLSCSSSNSKEDENILSLDDLIQSHVYEECVFDPKYLSYFFASVLTRLLKARRLATSRSKLHILHRRKTWTLHNLPNSLRKWCSKKSARSRQLSLPPNTFLRLNPSPLLPRNLASATFLLPLRPWYTHRKNHAQSTFIKPAISSCMLKVLQSPCCLAEHPISRHEVSRRDSSSRHCRSGTREFVKWSVRPCRLVEVAAAPKGHSDEETNA